MTVAGLKLRERIRRRYRTDAVRLNLDSLELGFTRLSEPDRVLDEAVAEEDRRKADLNSVKEPPRVPYWAELWESAIGLAQVIGRTSLVGKSVLDLGCGMGLAGAAAAAMGANVLLADIESQALLLARLNTAPWQDRVRARRVNWQTDQLGERFDLILGADILYEKDQWPFLHSFWKEHLAEGGEILLGEPGRQTGEKFPAWATNLGWKIEQTTELIESVGKRVRVFRLKLEELVHE